MKIRDMEKYRKVDHLGFEVIEGVLPGESEHTDYMVTKSMTHELDSEIEILDPCACWGCWHPEDNDGYQSDVCVHCGY